MYEITLSVRKEVIRMFLQGVSFDAIARQLGIGKGSVVNIIEEFREGDLAIPSDMTGLIDTLRKIAVDLRKHNASISQVMIYARLHAKLKEMGVGVEKVEQWVDTCQEIASSSASGNELVNAAMAFKQLESETGLGYKELIIDYKAKRNERDELHEEIEQEKATLIKVKSEHNKERETATKQLDSITQAIHTAQASFRQQINDLKIRLDKHLAQNKLSWKKVDLALALFDSELGKSGTPKQAIDQLTERILNTQSLVKVNKQLKQEKARLKSEAAVLVQEKQRSIEEINKLRELDKNFRESLSANIEKSEELGTGLKSKRAELKELEQTTFEYTHNLYISRLIIDFLFLPSNLSEYDLDRLVNLFVVLRQERLGIEPNRVTDTNGEVICECLIPKIYGNIKGSDSDIDSIRETFARLLTPLVKDKFISRFEYDMAESRHKKDVLLAILEERDRNKASVQLALMMYGTRTK